MVGWLAGSLVVYLVGPLVVWLVRQLFDLGCLVAWLVGCLAGWLVGRLVACRLVAWLVCCLVGFGLAGWLGSTRQRLVPSPGALTEREVGGGQNLQNLSIFSRVRLKAL